MEEKCNNDNSAGDFNAAFLKRLRPIIIAVAFLLFFLSTSGILLMLSLARSGHVDFRHLYTAGYMVRIGRGAELYDYAKYQQLQNELVGPAVGALPFNHVAYESLLYVPFSFLGYRHAYLAFLAANLLALAASLRMLRPVLFPLAEVWTLLPAAMLGCFLPVAIALIEGQDSLFLLALFAGSIVADHARQELKAGILLGLTLFKFQYALPIVFLFLVWKRWRFLAGFSLSGALVLVISVCLTGFSGTVSYLQSIIAMSTGFSQANASLYGIHPEGMANLRGISYGVSGGSISIMHFLTAFSTAIVLLYAAFKRPSYSGAMLASLLVSYHQVIADTSLLFLPVALVLAGVMTSITTRRKQLAAMFACLAFVGPTLLLFAGTRFHLLAIPVLGLFIFWDADGPSSKDEIVCGAQRQQTDTKKFLPRQ